MAETNHKKTLLLSLAFSTVFCGSFVYFYVNSHPRSNEKKDPLILTNAVLGKTIPAVDFEDSNGNRISYESLKNEKMVIVVVSSGCSACDDENYFLKTLQLKDHPLKFYGLLV